MAAEADDDWLLDDVQLFSPLCSVKQMLCSLFVADVVGKCRV